MPRPKTVRELREDILGSERLKARPQEEISRSLRLHQATLSRILRGKFKRRSDAVERVCKYANISCITDAPLAELDASLARLTRVATGSSTSHRHAIKLIRLAAELLESESAAER
jgi:hypothetical protein